MIVPNQLLLQGWGYRSYPKRKSTNFILTLNYTE
jgi:hypothetical protein